MKQKKQQKSPLQIKEWNWLNYYPGRAPKPYGMGVTDEEILEDLTDHINVSGSLKGNKIA